MTTNWREIWQQYCTSVHVETIDQSKHDTRIVSFGCITDMPQDSTPLSPSPAAYLTCFTPGRAWNNFPAGAGQTYFCSETTRFWPDRCLSPRIICLHFTVKYMRTHALLNLQWWLYRGQSNKFLTCNSWKMKNHCHAVLQKFHVVAKLWNSGKSVKFGRNLTKIHVSSTYLRLLSANGAVFAINLQIYLETSTLQRENVSKLPGVVTLLSEKPGTGQCMI